MKQNKYKPTMIQVVEARKAGQFVRAKNWSKNGKDKCPKKLRRQNKSNLRGY